MVLYEEMVASRYDESSFAERGRLFNEGWLMLVECELGMREFRVEEVVVGVDWGYSDSMLLICSSINGGGSEK